MNKNAMPGEWMAMLGMAGMAGLWWANATKRDRETFHALIRDKGITDPREIWDLCCEHHKKLKGELVEAQTRIAAGEEICRVGQGLSELRNMMKGEDLPAPIRSKRFWGQEVSEKEMADAIEEVRKAEVPLEVKQAIIAHWWTELWKLFVPWGILTPSEIESVDGPFFKLVRPDIREAALRGEVFRYKNLYDAQKKSSEEWRHSIIKDMEKHIEESDSWRKREEDLLRKIDVLNSIVARHESGELDDDI